MRIYDRVILVLLALILLVSNMSFAYANLLVCGLSNNEIKIDSEFRGEKILLFGAKEDGRDLIINVIGPERDFAISKKQKLMGVWYNGKGFEFKNIPTLHYLFSTMDDNQNAKDILNELKLEKENLISESTKSGSQSYEKDKAKELLKELIKKMTDKKLYQEQYNYIDFLNDTLFKVSLDFPENIMPGSYLVEVYLIGDGGLLSYQSIPIKVTQAGIGEKIVNFAYNYSLLYAIFSVIFALATGWVVNYIFSRFVFK